MTTTIMVEAIENYIVATLQDVTGLDDVKVFIKGGLPPGIMVPQDKYPFSEVFCGRAANDDELTGNYYEDRYVGLITFSVLTTQQANADWLEMSGERVVELESYRQVRRLVHAAVDELRKSEHRDLGALAVGDAVVVRFYITEPTYGFDLNARSNNWENFGSIPFEVEVQETY